jgi:hypothetical protein
LIKTIQLRTTERSRQWRQKGLKKNEKLNKKILKGFQLSKRTGIIDCELINNDRVLIRGNAITAFKIEIGL